jgi:hypothetical protein
VEVIHAGVSLQYSTGRVDEGVRPKVFWNVIKAGDLEQRRSEAAGSLRLAVHMNLCVGPTDEEAIRLHEPRPELWHNYVRARENIL